MSAEHGPTGLPPGPQGPAARAAGLIAVAEDLAGEFSLRPLLERVLRRCTELLGCSAGSICSVDEAAGTYRKEADNGQGFDPKAGWQGDRFGLRAISERTRVLGATIDVDSLAGWGTRIRARFPYRPHHQQSAPRLRVLIAAARPMLRAGIARLLAATEPGTEVIGEVATAADALEACEDLRPDVVLADLGLSHDGASAGRDGPDGGVTGLLLARDRVSPPPKMGVSTDPPGDGDA